MHPDSWDEFPDKVAFQMNDTHPTLLGGPPLPPAWPAALPEGGARAIPWPPFLTPFGTPSPQRKPPHNHLSTFMHILALLAPLLNT
jgi:hypothetical protein